MTGSVFTSSTTRTSPGPLSELTISVDGVLLQGVDGDGVVWGLSDSESWWSAASVRTAVADRPSSDGVYAGPARRGQKVLVLTGTAYCPTPAARRAVTDRVQGMCADPDVMYELVATDVDGHVDRCWVRLAPGPGPRAVPTTPGTVAFQVQLLVPDGLRHGPALSASTQAANDTGGLRFDLFSDGAGAALGYLHFGDLGSTGRVVLTNTGSAPAWPTFIVTGPLPGFELTETRTGRVLRYEDPIAAGGQFVQLRSETGQVLLDGQYDRSGRLTVRDWWSVPPGGEAEVLFMPTGVPSAPGATLSVEWAAARR